MSTHIGLIGLGTMGANLARNAARNGATVAVYNRTTEKTDAFMTAYSNEGTFVACRTINELISTLPTPRTIILMVNAGKPVDDVIAELCKDGLVAGDTIVDAGNSHFLDTERRQTELQTLGIHFLGMGVSGGEEGALLGPSMMPSGERSSYDALLPLLQKMSAKDGSGGKCVTFVGNGGAGHFVKMVHNGIEYGDMQLIAEAYHLMRSVIGLGNPAIAEVFETWNKKRELKSFLIEITAQILRTTDDMSTGDLLDVIKDEAAQKGTGKWTTQAALDAGCTVPTMTAAVDARLLSAMKPLRTAASRSFGVLETKSVKLSVNLIRDALILSKICSYAQGIAMIAHVSRDKNWGVDLGEVCRIWKGGCIIRSALLKNFESAFREQPDLLNLMLAPSIAEIFTARHTKWRKVVASGVLAGIPLPAMSASLSYFDTVRSTWLPQNMTQAQRDFFGAHGFMRMDREGTFHGKWKT